MADKIKVNVKTVLGIQDSLQDDVLDVLISNVSSHLLGLLKKVNKDISVIPSEINYIVEEITIRRYNRIGTEGAKSESVEGHTISFYDLKDEFVPYQDIIDDYKDGSEDSAKRGKVTFF